METLGVQCDELLLFMIMVFTMKSACLVDAGFDNLQVVFGEALESFERTLAVVSNAVVNALLNIGANVSSVLS